MAIRQAKPITPGLRGASYDSFSDITSTTPERQLLVIRKKHSGRNNQGKITVRHRGGGSKRYIRLVDFKRDKFDIPGRVKAIEYDPNRGARLALVYYLDGEKRYIIAPLGLKVGDEVLSSKKLIDIKTGNALPLEYIPAGVPVHNVELRPGFGGKLARAAGNVLYVMGVDKRYAQLKMPSGEIRLVDKNCLCTIGQVSNPELARINLGKAGRTRHLGIRPTVRGTAMNPNDHPHGGGEGNQPIGLKYPKTPWGKHALGVRTRNPKAANNALIIRRRQKKH
ncbi:50S ribosomal protein L2 [Patescibacteria group bacterium]|jgi:large subunit ribosomal protein L2|nr:50S ribosomal protein L2 [Patescibacteria group bacterium]HPD07623.1 50S ribosomal protein L2 [bacterium]HRT10938.1 50S ribosomal protein L2 [Patescibacteria group bacterium]HRU89789.1 50S ribosomal protein L2 [Patescibacteria group bacterium]